MATRQILAERAGAYQQKTGHSVAIESVGGVDAARRIRAGEKFDIVVLADDAMRKLEEDGFPETREPRRVCGFGDCGGCAIRGRAS